MLTRETHSENIKNALPHVHRETASQDLISSEITNQGSPFPPSLLNMYPAVFPPVAYSEEFPYPPGLRPVSF